MPSIVIKISRAARRADDSPPNMRGRPSPVHSASEWQWFVLLENLDARSNAACLPVEWSTTSATWKFLRTEASYGGQSKCPRIEDISGFCYGLTGEGIMGRPRWLGTGRGNIEALSHGMPSYEGKLDGALAAGGSATFSIYTCRTGSWLDTSVNLTVHSPPRLSSGSIATGKWARVYYDLTRPGWTVDSAEC